jgi:type I restriction-modification system DNA methylase subunit
MNREQARDLIERTFTQKFDKSRFLNFTRNLLNHIDESKASSWNSQYVKDAFKTHVQRYERLGTYRTPSKENVDLLVVYLTAESKLERARTAIRNFVADHLKARDEKDAALVAFVAPTESTWRFSYVKMEYATVEKDSCGIGVEARLTPARRFSYIVGEGESCHTAQRRFLALLQDTAADPTLADIEDAFSVEAVTKEFFTKYADLFEDIHKGLDRLLAKDKVVRQEFTAKAVNTVDFAKKLMGQIVFLYFLQKKGWLGVTKGEEWGTGPHDFLRRLASGAYCKYDNFFNDILEPLFYDILATDRGHEAWCDRFNCRIPFLNGGLFEPLGDYDWRKSEIILPNKLFTNSTAFEEGITGTGVLDVFDRYNFTVNEAEPLEKEVAIDPEMLGKVFENLIEENRRKGMGAFYTPREIVHYMCQESLVDYLATAINKEELAVPRTDIEIFVYHGEQYSFYEAAKRSGTIGKEYPRPPKSIEQHARRIDEKLAEITICDPAVGSGAFPVGMMTEVVRARSALTPYFNDFHERTPYHFKRHAIQNCLYGVDIDSGAVEIAKLRLWLSLVVDEEETQQIKPLPNLDYKIVSGNSLLGFPFKSQRLQELELLKQQYLDESDHTAKVKLKTTIDSELRACFASSKVSLGYVVSFDFEAFFSEVFSRRKGFDVVIGNPPYINIEKISEQDRAIYLKIFGENGKLGKRYDVYQLFIMKGVSLNAIGGTLAYILPNTFLMGSSYLILRRRLCLRTLISAIVDLPQNVFESATVDNVLLFVRKASEPGHQIEIAVLNTDSSLSRISARDWDDAFTISQDELHDANQFKINVHMNPLLRDLFAKIESGSVRLGEITDPSQGIIIYETEEDAKRNLYTSFKNQNGWKKLLRGTNVGYYCTKWEGEYLHYGDWLWRSREEKYFNRPKLLLHAMRNKGLKRRLVATYDDERHYNAHNLANIIAKDDSGYDLKYVLGIFNSSLINFWYRNHFPNVNINPNDLRQIPVQIADKKKQTFLAGLVDKILAAKRRDPEANTSVLEFEIDRAVYALYGLNEKEIAIVEGSLRKAAAGQ